MSDFPSLANDADAVPRRKPLVAISLTPIALTDSPVDAFRRSNRVPEKTATTRRSPLIAADLEAVFSSHLAWTADNAQAVNRPSPWIVNNVSSCVNAIHSIGASPGG